MPDQDQQNIPPTFEASCSAKERMRGEEIWFDIRHRLLAEKHPAGNSVYGVKIYFEDRGQPDIVPHIIGNYLRLSDASFGGAKKISYLADEIFKVKTIAEKIGSELILGRIEDHDIQTARGRHLIDDVQTLRDLLDDARIALTGAEVVAARVRDLSRGDRRVGLDAALLGTPLHVMASHLSHVWVGVGLSLSGGRSGGGLDEVIVRIVEAVRGEKDRGPRKWLKELMTQVRVENNS